MISVKSITMGNDVTSSSSTSTSPLTSPLTPLQPGSPSPLTTLPPLSTPTPPSTTITTPPSTTTTLPPTTPTPPSTTTTTPPPPPPTSPPPPTPPTPPPTPPLSTPTPSTTTPTPTPPTPSTPPPPVHQGFNNSDAMNKMLKNIKKDVKIIKNELKKNNYDSNIKINETPTLEQSEKDAEHKGKNGIDSDGMSGVKLEEKSTNLQPNKMDVNDKVCNVQNPMDKQTGMNTLEKNQNESESMVPKFRNSSSPQLQEQIILKAKTKIPVQCRKDGTEKEKNQPVLPTPSFGQREKHIQTNTHNSPDSETQSESNKPIESVAGLKTDMETHVETTYGPKRNTDSQQPFIKTSVQSSSSGLKKYMEKPIHGQQSLTNEMDTPTPVRRSTIRKDFDTTFPTSCLNKDTEDSINYQRTIQKDIDTSDHSVTCLKSAVDTPVTMGTPVHMRMDTPVQMDTPVRNSSGLQRPVLQPSHLFSQLCKRLNGSCDENKCKHLKKQMSWPSDSTNSRLQDEIIADLRSENSLIKSLVAGNSTSRTLRHLSVINEELSESTVPSNVETILTPTSGLINVSNSSCLLSTDHTLNNYLDSSRGLSSSNSKHLNNNNDNAQFGSSENISKQTENKSPIRSTSTSENKLPRVKAPCQKRIRRKNVSKIEKSNDAKDIHRKKGSRYSKGKNMESMNIFDGRKLVFLVPKPQNNLTSEIQNTQKIVFKDTIFNPGKTSKLKIPPTTTFKKCKISKPDRSSKLSIDNLTYPDCDTLNSNRSQTRFSNSKTRAYLCERTTSPILRKPIRQGAPKECSGPSSGKGVSFSFAGCGFLGLYHVGVTACLQKYLPGRCVDRILGSSAGAMAAASLMAGGDIGVITSSVLKAATEARARALGPFSPSFDIEKLLREGLLAVLPANAHEIVSGRLFVSVTRISDGKNVLLSQFDTREDLVQALLCSAFIPGFSGMRPLSVRGVRYMDGGFSDNMPELDSATVTVSPFCGEADVCPKDNTAGLITISLANTSIEISRENLQRFGRILFPPPPEVLNKMCQQGFNDALDFLQRNNLISCTRCVAVQSTVPLPHDGGGGGARAAAAAAAAAGAGYDGHEYDGPSGKEHARRFIDDEYEDEDDEYEEWEDNCADCQDCRQQRQDAILDELPDQVGSILQEAIDAANAEVSKWWGLSSPRKLFSLVVTPLTYTFKLPFRVARGIRSSLPSFPTLHKLQSFSSQMVELARTVLWSRRHAAVTEVSPAAAAAARPHHLHHHRKEQEFSCSVAITEFSREGQRYTTADAGDWSDMASDGEDDPWDHLAQLYAARSSRRASLVPTTSRGPSRAPSRAPSRGPSRGPSRAVSRRASVVDFDDCGLNLANLDDTVERIVNVATNTTEDALMAYYYLDENNQMRVTEIFDMSSALPELDSFRHPSPHHLAAPHNAPGGGGGGGGGSPGGGLFRRQQLQQQQQQQQQQQHIQQRLASFRDQTERGTSSDNDERETDDERETTGTGTGTGTGTETETETDPEVGDEAVNEAPETEVKRLAEPREETNLADDEAEEDEDEEDRASYASYASSSRSLSEPEADQHLSEG